MKRKKVKSLTLEKTTISSLKKNSVIGGKLMNTRTYWISVCECPETIAPEFTCDWGS